ncbi:MAG: hypothetical protein KKA05_11880 [Alphaproteobacteria bacterium]|nr:hypothetical protein [Alphaproteobacteria bacterium]
MSAPQDVMNQLLRRRMAVAKIAGLLGEAEMCSMAAMQMASVPGGMISSTAKLEQARNFMTAADHIAKTELVET